MDVDIAVLSGEPTVGTSSVPPSSQSVPCFPVTSQKLVISFSVEVAGTSARWVQQTFLEPSCVLGTGEWSMQRCESPAFLVVSSALHVL